MQKLPVASKGYVSYNLLLIHNGEIHLPMYYTGMCGNLGFSDTLSMVSEFTKPEIYIKSNRRKFLFKIPFERNSRVPDSLSMLAMLDSIQHYQVDTILVDAFSSVEGFSNINTSLYKDRSLAIHSQIKPYTDTITVLQMQAKENWGLFYKQLQNTKYSHWKDWEHERIKQELQKPEVLIDWEKRLAEQRKATVTINAHSVVRDTLAYVYKHYRIQKPLDAFVMQNYLYSLWQGQRIHPDSIRNINYPYRHEYSSLISNQLVFNHQVYSTGWSKQEYDSFYNAFLKAVAIPRASNVLVYNYLVHVITNWHTLQKEKGVSAERTYRLLKQLEKTGGYGTEMRRLKALFFVKALPAFVSATNIKRVNEGLVTVFSYYSHEAKILKDKDQTLRLAKYFLELGDTEHAYEVLDSYLKNNSFEKEIFAYYLKIAFVHPLYQKNGEYIKLLIEAKRLFAEEQWCDLFVGPCNINFQIFDDEALRNLYCESCADRGNHATSLKK
jgi:hypothetical protein